MATKAKINDTEYYKERLFSLFPSLSDSHRELLGNNTTILSIPKGRFIYHENEHPVGFVCLLEGNAKVVKLGLNGRGQIIRMVRPMGVIGYRALFACENYRSSAKTLDDSMIAIIDGDVFFEILQKNAIMSMNILRIIACELGLANLRTINLTQKHLRGRLADTLLFLVETYGFMEDSKTLAVTLTRSDLAQLSSMTTSNAIRTLSGFSSEGLVELRNKRIAIVNQETLHHISELG